MRAAALLLLLSQFAFAQSQSTPRPEDLGTVTGHITCADTQRPARLATVSLFSPNGILAGQTVETDLDGAYLISVPPGVYYLSINLSGYINPFPRFAHRQLAHATTQIQQRIDQELPAITVAPHSTLQNDVTLHRGGSISGTVRYDDGSPAINVTINVYRRSPQGGSPEIVWPPDTTDGEGHFKVQSLSRGDYIVCALLSTTEQVPQKVLIDGKLAQLTIVTISYTLQIYSGGAFRQQEADVIKVDESEQTSGADITIPLSRLHSVSGTLTAQDGHAISGGRVEIYFADRNDGLQGVPVGEDGTFRFPYVPEGNYNLLIQATDITRVKISRPGSSFIEERPVRSYGAFTQPLAVHTDLQSLNITVPDKPTTAASN